MKIAIASENNNINSKVDDRFGRSEYFAIIDIKNNSIENIKFIENKCKDDVSGAGQKIVKCLFENSVDVVIVPEIGPKAKIALREFQLKALKKGNCIYLSEAIQAFKDDTLEIYSLEEPNGLRRA